MSKAFRWPDKAVEKVQKYIALTGDIKGAVKKFRRICPGINYLNLHKKISRECWITPDKINRKAQAMAKKRERQEIIVESAKSLIEQGREMEAVVFKKIKRRIEETEVPEIKDIKDLDLADKIMRRQWGAESQEEGSGNKFNLFLLQQRLPQADYANAEVVSED